MPDQASILCPSFRCQDGAILLGIVQENGRVAFAAQRIIIDHEFVRIAKSGRAPEKRFRFSGKCVQGACKQWTGDRCGVIENVLADLESVAPAAQLPECSIRPECRWYLQAGPSACGVCPEVITDLTTMADGEFADRPQESVSLGTERLTRGNT